MIELYHLIMINGQNMIKEHIKIDIDDNFYFYNNFNFILKKYLNIIFLFHFKKIFKYNILYLNKKI